MIPDSSTIGLQEKSVAAIYKKTCHAHLRLIIDHQESGYNNSPRETVALIVDRIADHRQKEVNLKTTKVQPYAADLFFTLKLSERSINYLAANDPGVFNLRQIIAPKNEIICNSVNGGFGKCICDDMT
jgi:hypothetical protein